MTTEALVTIAGRAVRRQGNGSLSRRKRRWTVAFLISATLGAVAGVSGLGINTLFLLRLAQNNGPIGSISILLLVIAFPLLFLGAHCLDKVDAVERAIRLEYCRKRGLDHNHCWPDER